MQFPWRPIGRQAMYDHGCYSRHAGLHIAYTLKADVFCINRSLPSAVKAPTCTYCWLCIFIQRFTYTRRRWLTGPQAVVSCIVMQSSTSWNSYCYLWPPYGIGQAIVYFVLWFLLSSSFFFFSSPILSGWRLDVYRTSTQWCGLSANFECRSEMCCTRHAGITERKNDAKNRHLRTIAPQFCRAASSQLKHISTVGKTF